MTRRKKTSSRGLGDDPLKWIKDEAARAADAPGDPEPEVSMVSEAGRAEDGASTQATPSTPAMTAIESGEPIVLDAVITIAETAALKDQLLPHINRKGEVSVDGTRVESVDTAALQVLLAFVRTLQNHGAVVRWTGVSEALLGTAQLLGVAKHIGLRV